MMPSGTDLPVALTFDLDPDQFDSSIGSDFGTDRLGWRGVENGVPVIVDMLDDLARLAGVVVPATWLARCDNQIEALYGDAGAIIDRFRCLIDTLAARGDEIGWHPHLSRKTDGVWRQETDAGEVAAILRSSHAAIAARGIHPRSTRIGGNFGSNAILDVLDELRLEVDSSAMPGRSRQDPERVFDWQGTPAEPYRPARADYRHAGVPAHRVVEVPMTMVPVQAAYDDRAYLRYVDLSFHPAMLRPGLTERLRHCSVLVCDTHPSTILPEIGQLHGLLSFSPESFRRNLLAITECAAEAGRVVRFVRLSDCASLARAGARA